MPTHHVVSGSQERISAVDSVQFLRWAQRQSSCSDTVCKMISIYLITQCSTIQIIRNSGRTATVLPLPRSNTPCMQISVCYILVQNIYATLNLFFSQSAKRKCVEEDGSLCQPTRVVWGTIRQWRSSFYNPSWRSPDRVPGHDANQGGARGSKYAAPGLSG